MYKTYIIHTLSRRFGAGRETTLSRTPSKIRTCGVALGLSINSKELKKTDFKF